MFNKQIKKQNIRYDWLRAITVVASVLLPTLAAAGPDELRARLLSHGAQDKQAPSADTPVSKQITPNAVPMTARDRLTALSERLAKRQNGAPRAPAAGSRPVKFMTIQERLLAQRAAGKSKQAMVNRGANPLPMMSMRERLQQMSREHQRNPAAKTQKVGCTGRANNAGPLERLRQRANAPARETDCVQ